MGLHLKNKEERKSASVKRADTPLADSPEAEAPAIDLKSALDDIGRRSLDRQKSMDRSQAKLEAARVERSKENPNQTGGGKLQGLASLKNTLGMQYAKKEKEE